MEVGYPLYNTSFALHRLSPLYYGQRDILQRSTLRQCASRFRDILQGKTLRGVQIGASDGNDGMSRVGALQSCTWKILGNEAAWAEIQQRDELDGEVNEFDIPDDERRGLLVQVQYEKTTYKALMLRDLDTSTILDQRNGFIHFPLLLTRMPMSLREIFTAFLSDTFDSHISILKLPSPIVGEVLEQFLDDITPNPTPRNAISVDSAIHYLQLTLSFPPPIAPSLKILEVTVTLKDILRFKSEGQKLNHQRDPSASTHELEGSYLGDFLTGLSNLLDHSLAMPLGKDDIILSKIACDAFVLAADGKLKIVPPKGTIDTDGKKRAKHAINTLVATLLRKAQGSIQIES